MDVLHSTDDTEPSEEAIEKFLAAVAMTGLSWSEIRDDQSALRERRQKEETIKLKEREIVEAGLVIEGNAAIISGLDAENERVMRLDSDYATPARKIETAKANIWAATTTIEKAEEVLKRIRIESPRAFGNFPEVSL
jgi:hypothetical protein